MSWVGRGLKKPWATAAISGASGRKSLVQNGIMLHVNTSHLGVSVSRVLSEAWFPCVGAQDGLPGLFYYADMN